MPRLGLDHTTEATGGRSDRCWKTQTQTPLGRAGALGRWLVGGRAFSAELICVPDNSPVSGSSACEVRVLALRINLLSGVAKKHGGG